MKFGHWSEPVKTQKIYSALPKDKTTIPEYLLDAEIDQMLNDAVDECHKMVSLIPEQAKRNVGAGRRMERNRFLKVCARCSTVHKIQTQKELRETLKHFTPEQLSAR